jgi:hypothetical protein
MKAPAMHSPIAYSTIESDEAAVMASFVTARLWIRRLLVTFIERAQSSFTDKK